MRIDRKGRTGLSRRICLLIAAVLIAAGCATAGRDFPDERVTDIQVDRTTRSEIRSMFGSPWRVGMEDGQTIWTYGEYRYRLFGETLTRDLVIRFDDQGRVASYTFNTTEHNE